MQSRLSRLNTIRVWNVIKSFLKYRKHSFERLMAISEYYFPMFEEAFAKENVPLEISTIYC
jgi:hypothetical protein